MVDFHPGWVELEMRWMRCLLLPEVSILIPLTADHIYIQVPRYVYLKEYPITRLLVKCFPMMDHAHRRF